MKILHVCNHFYPCIGGVERYVLDLSKELINAGHKSDVACLNTCAYNKDVFSEKESVDGITVYRMPYLNLKYYKIAPSVLKFAKDYDIIHIHGIGFFSDFLSITKFLHKKPMILSTHGGIFATSNILGVKKIYFNVITRFVLRGMESVIATGKNDFGIFSKISGNVVLIPPGINYAKFSSIKHKPVKNTFLFVGRLSKNKRIDNLIKTIGALKKKVPGVKLFVVGGDWDDSLKPMQALCRTLGIEKNVIFTGKTDDLKLQQYYSRSQFFVSASEYEGFGISVAEAMAAGCVPILNDIDAFRALVNDKKNGFIVNFSASETAAEIIYKVMGRKDLSNIAVNSKASANKYDWKKISEKIAGLYEEHKISQRIL